MLRDWCARNSRLYRLIEMSADLGKVCPHCEERLAHRTVREHMRLFFYAQPRIQRASSSSNASR